LSTTAIFDVERGSQTKPRANFWSSSHKHVANAVGYASRTLLRIASAAVSLVKKPSRKR